VRLRTSTVEGLSNTASFCIETRISGDAGSGGDPAGANATSGSSQAEGADAASMASLSALGW
jgi:hypothetical protein